MNIYKVSTTHIKLDPNEYFRVRECDPGESGPPGIEVHSVQCNGTTVWATGLAVRKDGTVGKRFCKVLLDLEDLPIRVLVGLATFHLDDG